MRFTNQQLMLAGGAWAALGVVAFAATELFGDAVGVSVVYVCALAGALAFVMTAARSALGDRPDRPSAEQAKAMRRNRAIVRSLLAVAAADGKLAERELNVIENFASKLADVTIGDDLVRELFDEMTAHPVSIGDELSAIAKDMSDEDRVTAFQGAALVAYSLDSVGPKERAALDEIAKALKLSPEAAKLVEDRAQQAFAETGVASTVRYWLGLDR